MKNYKIVSYKTGREIDQNESVTSDPLTGGPLEVVYDYDKLRENFNSYIFESSHISARKYIDLYPICDQNNVVSLDEGGTPLYQSKTLYKTFGIDKLYFKNEGANPTGSFKDRGTMVEVTKAVEMGAKGITLASTGNMAASVSAYCARAHIPCYVFIPEGTPSGKLAQMLSYGAKVIQIRGDYGTAARLAELTAKKYKFYLAGDYCFRQEGQKSIAYEIIEQMLFKVPDYVIVPVGVGTNISAIWKGFVEYRKLGLIDSLPKMIAVQAEGASPIIKSFNLNLEECVCVSPNTISSAIAVGSPLDASKVINLLKKSQGMAISVDDESTLEMQNLLAREESIFTEPSSATTIAALRKMKKLKLLDKNGTYVCVLTGTGLKDPSSALKILSDPPKIDPNIEEVAKLFSSKVLEIRSIITKKREDEIFSSMPTQRQITKVIKESFNLNIKKDELRKMEAQIANFLKKGKKITKADLQYILENIMQSYVAKADRIMKLKDFTITDNFKRRPQASCSVYLFGKIVESKAVGVGPVDAIIKALLKAGNGLAKKIKLIDYDVNTNSFGTDATVSVDIKLENAEGFQVICTGASPDIIQASIDAFIDGFNILYKKTQELKAKTKH